MEDPNQLLLTWQSGEARCDHFQVHLTNFVPTAELRIGFFDVPEAKPTKAVPGKINR